MLITKPRIYLRGMNRNTVIVDGTKPGHPVAVLRVATRTSGPKDKKGALGLNGIMVWKAGDVWVQNLTVCNFLGGSGGDGDTGNEIWWNGGADSGKVGGHGYYGSYMTATSTYFKGEAHRGRVRDLLEQLDRRHLGPELHEQFQRLGLLHRRLPAGLPPDDGQRVGRVQRARVLGFELGRLDADRELAL